MNKGWSWRENELSLKEYYLLSTEKKIEYLHLLKLMDTGSRSTGDNFILSNFSKEKEEARKFLSLDDLD